MSPKDTKLQIRITSELDSNINKTVEFFKEKTGVKTTKTTIIESAIEEGLKVITEKLENK